MFTLSNLIKRGANYLFLVLLVRSVSISMIGSYSAYLNLITVLLLITNFGFSEFILVNSKDENSLKTNISIFMQISLLLFFVILVSSLVVPLNDVKLAVLILIKTYLETSFYNIFLSYYQVKNKIKSITITNVISGISIIIISFSFYFFNYDIYAYLYGINIIYILIALGLFYDIRFNFNTMRKMFSFVKLKFSVLKYYGVGMITVPIYMMAPTAIGSFLLSPSSLAQYQIAFSIANVLLLISVSMLQVGYVKFLEHRNDYFSLIRLLKKTGAKILIINMFFLFTVILFGREILLLVYEKEEYVKAYSPLILLLLSNIIFMFASISAVIMVIFKLQKEKTKYHMEFIIVSIFFGFLLTSIYGVNGLASSYIILYSYSTIRYIKKNIKIYNEHSLLK